MNDNLIIFNAFRRSGQHAIIHWLQKQTQGSTTFLNDIKISNHVLNDKSKWRHKPLKKSYNYVFMSMEDHNVENVFTEFRQNKIQQLVGDSKKIYEVLILRDPFNNFASRLMSLRKKEAWWSWANKEENMRNVFAYKEMWKSHAKEFISLTNFMPNKICIDYNRWCSSEDYRKKITEIFNISFTDEGFLDIVHMRSSFSNHIETLHSDVMDRWRYFQDDEYYLNLFDDEMIDLSRSIWGDSINEASITISNNRMIKNFKRTLLIAVNTKMESSFNLPENIEYDVTQIKPKNGMVKKLEYNKCKEKEFVLLINNDCDIDDIEKYMDLLSQNRRVGAVGKYTVEETNKTKNEIFVWQKQKNTHKQPIPMIKYDFLLLKTTLLENIGYSGENILFLYFKDSNLSTIKV